MDANHREWLSIYSYSLVSIRGSKITQHSPEVEDDQSNENPKSRDDSYFPLIANGTLKSGVTIVSGQLLTVFRNSRFRDFFKQAENERIGIVAFGLCLEIWGDAMSENRDCYFPDISE